MQILFRTCVDETELCKGKPLCDNKNDLKWCKDVWDLPSPNFKHILDDNYRQHYKCNRSHQRENSVPNGQDILAQDISDGYFYNCFNRADEDPFKKSTHNQSEDEGDKSWSDWVRTPCQNTDSRRCLGQKPSQCVHSYGLYI